MDYASISSQKVFSDGAITAGIECVCGGRTSISRYEMEYSVRHKKDVSTLYTKCEKCSRNYRFVELQPHHFSSLPLSLWVSHKLRDKKTEVNFVLFAVFTLTWIMILFYFLASEF